MKKTLTFKKTNHDDWYYSCQGIRWCPTGLEIFYCDRSLPASFKLQISTTPIKGTKVTWDEDSLSWRTETGETFTTTRWQDRLSDKLFDYAAELWVKVV